MKEYTIQPSKGGPAYTFTAELAAHVTSKRPKSYIWTEIEAYKTLSGRTVVVTKSLSSFDTRKDIIEVRVFEDNEEMFRKIGYTKLSRRLYYKLGITEIKVD
jgi:hypothetical protein